MCVLHIAASRGGATRDRCVDTKEARLDRRRAKGHRRNSPQNSIVTCFAALQHNIWARVGKTNRWIDLMSATAFLVTVAALVAVTVAARVGVNSGGLGDLPHPSQVD